MTQVDFYILDNPAPSARAHTACRLLDKAWDQGIPAYVHTDSARDSADIDRLLWTFKEGSFIPHSTLPCPPDNIAPILIGHAPDGPDDAAPTRLLINLSASVPSFVDRFDRVLEIIDGDQQRRQQGRRRYQHYKTNNYALSDHKL